MTRLPDPTFDQRIADWLEDDPTTAPPEVLGTVVAAFPSIEQRPGLRRPWRFPSMTRLALPAAAALVVAIAGSLVLPRLLTPPSGNKSPSPSTVDGTAAPTQHPSVPPATPEPSRAAALVAFQVRITNGLSRSTIWVESLDGSISRELLPGEAGSSLLGRTSDGNRLLVALAADAPTLALVDINTGELTIVPTDCPSDPCWADFQSPFGSFGQVTLADDDRTAVAVLRDDSNGHQVVATIDLSTGRTEPIKGSRGIFIGAPGLLWPRLSPDGTKVAYEVGNGNLLACYGDGGMLIVVDRLGDSDTQRQLVPFDACATDPRWSPEGDELLYTTAEVTNVPTGTTPEGGSTFFAVEHHEIYRVTLDGSIERLTTGRVSSYGAWTRDGQISFARCDPNCDEPVLEVEILDPETGELSRVEGTLTGLDEAGCIECPFMWKNRLVVGFWPEARDGQ